MSIQGDSGPARSAKPRLVAGALTCSALVFVVVAIGAAPDPAFSRSASSTSPRALTLGGPSAQRPVRSRGVVVFVRCRMRGCRVSAQGTVRVPQLDRGRHPGFPARTSKARTVKLTAVRRRLVRQGARRKLKLRLTKRTHALIDGALTEKSSLTVKIKATATGSRGSARAVRKIKLKRCTTKAEPDPKTDYVTYTLPDCASLLRLSLPAAIPDFFHSTETGVGGFGLHAGGHIEGLDHVWIELKPGTPQRAWADGVVRNVSVQGMAELGEIHIEIDHGKNLLGIHMEIAQPYVKKGDVVKRGQPVGLGMSFTPGQASGEFDLIDRGRTDGVKRGGREGGVHVSPWDYLQPSEKRQIVDAYKEKVLDPFKQTGDRRQVFSMFEPYQPYLTNNGFLHDEREGRLSGAWYSLTKWRSQYPNDLLTFIEADNPYLKGNVVMASEDSSEGSRNAWSLNGSFTVDYKRGRLTIHDESGRTYYGIFTIDERGKRARLKIEYQEGSFPAGFSSKALDYIERSDLSRREDAVRLGLLDSR